MSSFISNPRDGQPTAHQATGANNASIEAMFSHIMDAVRESVRGRWLLALIHLTEM